MRRSLIALTAVVSAAPLAHAESWNTPESRARWATLSAAVYGPQPKLEDAQGAIKLDAPQTAQDAALVPVTIHVAPQVQAKSLDLVVDENPSPVAAKITFGPAGDARKLALRVRVDAFTNMHAVATDAAGKHLETVAFVMGAGGCSAPMGSGADEAAAHMGEMRMKFAADATLGGAPQATLMIRHPNFNGMQMDQGKHALIPPRYIKSIEVKRGDAQVLAMTTDISLATNPVITFLYKADSANQPFTVTVADTGGGTWTQHFDARPTTN